MTLRIAAREEQLIEDITLRIRLGELTPGDRILPVKALCNRYNISQPVVQRALKHLENRGLLRIERRSGVFITEKAVELQGLHEETESKSAGKLPSPRVYGKETDLSVFMTPQSKSRTLTVYLLDFHGKVFDLWCEILKAESKRLGIGRLNILSCHDGHIEDLYDQQHIDLVQSTPGVLNALGPEKFVSFDSLEPVGLATEHLLDPVRKALDLEKTRPGVPFSLTLHLLFANRRLMEAHDLASLP
ncbi:MAG: winged helix-turn-helix transcriptional regulator [Planctomycetes bacterium]|nr:winged helix-turn-helix transcriptional regulator [Planctomycetota bacterium]